MLLTIPYQTLEIPNIHINPFQNDNKGRAIAPLSYKDSSIDINEVNVLTPPLTVESYDPVSCRLILSLKDAKSFSKKIILLQEFLVNTFFVHRYTLLGHNTTLDDIRQQFQMLANTDTLTVFIYPNMNISCSGTGNRIMQNIRCGDVIRFNIRLQGVVFGAKNRRLRIQHSVTNVWMVEDTGTDNKSPTNTSNSESSK